MSKESSVVESLDAGLEAGQANPVGEARVWPEPAGKLQDWALDLEKQHRPGPIAESIPASHPEVPAPSSQDQPTLKTKIVHTSALPEGELQFIAIEELHESAWNPRKYFSEKAMAELVESMRAGGFWSWNPLMARPRAAGGYELGAGHRRRRAALKAGLTVLPVIVRAMSDAQFLRVLTFDNSGREDPHPLDEAAGFHFYIEQTGAKVLDIAAEIGQSREYVYQRLQYAHLIPKAQQAFWDESINAGQAILIARLQPNEQALALKAATDGWADSVRELARWIEQNVLFNLQKAAFDPKSAELLPGTPPCTECPKRSGGSPELFADIKHRDTCTDPTCYHRKEDAHIQIQIAKRNADPDPKAAPLLKVATSHRSYGEKPPAGVLDRDSYVVIEKKADRCEHSREAIVVEGDRGKQLTVCSEKSCKKHHGQLSGGYRRSPQELAAEKKRNEEARRKEQLHAQAREAIVDAAKSPFTKRELLLIAGSIVRRMWHDHLTKILKAYNLEPTITKHSYGGSTKNFDKPMLAHLATLDDAALGKAIINLALWQDSEGHDQAVQEYKIDLKALSKAAAAPPAQPAKAKVPEKPKSATPKKKLSAKTRRAIAKGNKDRWKKFKQGQRKAIQKKAAK